MLRNIVNTIQRHAHRKRNKTVVALQFFRTFLFLFGGAIAIISVTVLKIKIIF